MKFSAGGAGQEHAFGMSGLWSGARLREPSGDANFDGGNGLRTGWGSGATVDQLIAAANGAEAPYQRAADDPQQETPYRTLELGAQCTQPHSMHRMIYKGDNQPIHPETNPKAIFDRLFTGTAAPTAPASDPGAAPSPAVVLDQLRLRKLDLLMSEVETLKTRVGTEEFAKVEAHLEGLRAIQRRLNTTSGATPPMPTAISGCQAPAEPAASKVTYENSKTFQADAKAMMDLAAHALACDATRVISVQLSRGFSNIVHEWAGVSQGHHTVSHLDGDHRAELQAIDTWYSTQFAYLLATLDSIQEGDGSLLDNTLVVWGREMGTTSHKMQPVPAILAGGARGGLAGGRLLDVKGQPHAKLLVSICRVMGLDVNTVGNIDVDSGPLSGVG
jgi:hypothetical protein